MKHTLASLTALLLVPLVALHVAWTWCRNKQAFTFLAIFGLAASGMAAEFFIRDGDRVAFLGDSITEGGKYTTYLQAYVLTRHPHWRITFRNVGWRGDTAWLRNRYHTDETALFRADPVTQQKMVNDAVINGLGHDVLPLNPTVVTVAMGMNDSYAARIEEAYPPFIRAETKIVEMLKEKGVRVALLTPQAMEGGGPPPDLDGGNKALKIFSDGIKEVAAATGVPFVDQYIPYLAICVSAHAANPGQFLYANGGDRIHPSALGQTIQAWIILKALGASALVSRVEINSATKTVVAAEACRIEKLTVADGVIRFERSDDVLPMPIPPEAMPALKLAPILDNLNRYELQVTGLAPGSYELSIDGEAVTKLTAAELAKGWNLAASTGPITRQGQELLQQIKEKDELFYSRWRKVQLFEVPEWAQKPADARTAELARLDQKIAEAEAQIDKLRHPHPHHFDLKPVVL